MKHSGLGIASFATSLVSAILIVLLVVFAGIIESATPGGMDEESALAIAIGLLLFGFLFLTFIALGLGIGALVQGGRNPLFAILGTVIASLTVSSTLLLMLVGLSMD